MLQGKSIPTESAHIADELLADSSLSIQDRKCLIVKQVVEDGDFELSEALEIYGVANAVYMDFVAQNVADSLQRSLGFKFDIHNKESGKSVFISYAFAVEAEILSKVIRLLSSSLQLDSDLSQAVDHLSAFSRKGVKDSAAR